LDNENNEIIPVSKPVNDTVPIGVAYAVFAVLGVMIIAALIFTGRGIWQWQRNTTDVSGKPDDAVQNLPEHIQRIYGPISREEEEPLELFVFVNEQLVNFRNGAPAPVGNVIFVPLNGVFEALGYIVSYNADENSAIIMDILDLHSAVIDVTVVNGVPMLPLRHAAEIMGYNVSFNAEQGVFHVYAPEPLPEEEPEEYEYEPSPTPTPRPAAPRRTPAPTPEPRNVPCHTCHTSGIVSCAPCNGIGGGRGLPFMSGIPHEISPTSDIWWCTACNGNGIVTCRTCNGTGTLTVNE
jgi:hypothetical protein